MTTRETDEDVDDHHQQPTNAKQEGDTTDHQIKRTTAKASSSSTGANISAAASSWSRLKDPRIVRVSRAFGGKDRHSKVCTVRGLRDRRVRLSVPTAIQLYDLQDRLGLNQPSKVVDWLLNVAKNEIDELPPLPNIPPGSFNHLNLQPILPNSHQSDKDAGGGGLRIGGTTSTANARIGGTTSTANASINWDDPSEPSGSNAWHSDPLFRPKSPKEAAAARNEEGKREESGFESHHHHSAYFSSNNFFSRLDPHHHHNPSSSSLGLLNSSTMAYNSMIRWDASNSNLSLSQSEGNSTPGLTVVPQQQQDQDFHNFGVLPLQSSNQQVLVYHQPGGTITHPYFPSPIASAADYAAGGSGGGGRVPFHLLGTTTKLFPLQNDDHHDHSQEKQGAENNSFHSR